MKLLFVNGCISQRGEESRTLVLARSFLDAWQARHPEAEVETVEPEALLALKPFLSSMRSDKVGTVLVLMRTMQLMGATNLFDWGKQD